jgi:hypothetical protein
MDFTVYYLLQRLHFKFRAAYLLFLLWTTGRDAHFHYHKVCGGKNILTSHGSLSSTTEHQCVEVIKSRTLASEHIKHLRLGHNFLHDL